MRKDGRVKRESISLQCLFCVTGVALDGKNPEQFDEAIHRHGREHCAHCTYRKENPGSSLPGYQD